MLGMASSSNTQVVRRARPTRYTGEGSNQQPIQQPDQEALHQPDEQLEDQEDVMAAQAPHVPRGPNQILGPVVLQEAKPVVWPVGPAEFDSLPRVTKIPTTISKLALDNIPGPYPTLNQWTSDGKEGLLKDFKVLSNYSPNLIIQFHSLRIQLGILLVNGLISVGPISVA